MSVLALMVNYKLTTYIPQLFLELLVFNEIRYNLMNTKSPLLCVVSAGSRDIRLLPGKMVLESEFSEIRDVSRLTQKSEIQYSCAFTRFEKNPEKPKKRCGM